jgi:hypothetical protein
VNRFALQSDLWPRPGTPRILKFHVARHDRFHRQLQDETKADSGLYGATPMTTVPHSTAVARGVNVRGRNLLPSSAYRIRGQRLWTAVLRDIGKRVRIMADLEKARLGAEETSRAKSQFVATMSLRLCELYVASADC